MSAWRDPRPTHDEAKAHIHTEYDSLLNSGWERHEARARVLPHVEQVLENWSEV